MTCSYARRPTHPSWSQAARPRAVIGAAVLLLQLGPHLPSAQARPATLAPFDFDTGNVLVERIIPAIIPVVLEDVSFGANDGTLVLRVTSMITVAAFDAIAPYHPTAVGIYSRLGRRPAAERASDRNKNVAIAHACHRVLLSLLPARAAEWRAVLQDVGLDPYDNSTDPTTAVGIGNAAGMATVAARERDGMNQLGDEGGQDYNRQPYADYTGFSPVNTADRIRDFRRWQPLVTTEGNGIFRVQEYVTPQLAITQPYALRDVRAYRSRPPLASLALGPSGRRAYRAQVDRALAVSASLNDEGKALAEFFDDKFRSLGFVALFVAQSRQFTLDEFVQYDMLENIAAFDAAIVAWQEKTRWNAIRPKSAIRYVYGDHPVTAWGGPGVGTVTDLPASQWKSYLPTADHPEYPSGSSCFCAAAAEASRRFTGTDQLGWDVPVPAGSSLYEPGVPARDVILRFPTWTAFEQECARARELGGTHFRAAAYESLELCRPVGAEAYRFVRAHIEGRAP